MVCPPAEGSRSADCIKILLYYTPFEKTAVNDLKQAWIERIGDECVAHDIPFFLEFVGYDEHGMQMRRALRTRRRSLPWSRDAWRSSARLATTWMC